MAGCNTASEHLCSGASDCCSCLLFDFSEVQGIYLKVVVGLKALQTLVYHESFIVDFFPCCSCKDSAMDAKCKWRLWVQTQVCGAIMHNSWKTDATQDQLKLGNVLSTNQNPAGL